MKIGILALQGDFELHQKVLNKLHVEQILVKNSQDLNQCDGLIIPGGESTTFLRLLSNNHLNQDIQKFGKHRTIFGTCAGLILLSTEVTNHNLQTLDLIDIQTERNAYGRQIDSFINTVNLTLGNNTIDFEGVFIRAPKIISAGEGVKKLGFLEKQIVMAENDHIVVSTFHPELTNDTRVHEYFLQKVKLTT